MVGESDRVVTKMVAERDRAHHDGSSVTPEALEALQRAGDRRVWDLSPLPEPALSRTTNVRVFIIEDDQKRSFAGQANLLIASGRSQRYSDHLRRSAVERIKDGSYGPTLHYNLDDSDGYVLDSWSEQDESGRLTHDPKEVVVDLLLDIMMPFEIEEERNQIVRGGVHGDEDLAPDTISERAEGVKRDLSESLDGLINSGAVSITRGGQAHRDGVRSSHFIICDLLKAAEYFQERSEDFRQRVDEIGDRAARTVVEVAARAGVFSTYGETASSEPDDQHLELERCIPRATFAERMEQSRDISAQLAFMAEQRLAVEGDEGEGFALFVDLALSREAGDEEWLANRLDEEDDEPDPLDRVIDEVMMSLVTALGREIEPDTDLYPFETVANSLIVYEVLKIDLDGESTATVTAGWRELARGLREEEIRCKPRAL
jgi:hypothetical protein